MRISDLREQLCDFMDAGITAMIYSAPGRGKSTFIQDLVKYLSDRDQFEWGLSLLFLATQTPTEMGGYVFKGERYWDAEGVLLNPSDRNYDITTPTLVTEPTLPLWMMSTAGKPIWAYRRGILFLDEYGQGEPDTKRASAEILLNGKYGPFHLPGFKTGDGWGVIGASNTSKHRSGVTKEFDFVINRRAEIHLTDDIIGTLDYLDRRGLLPSLRVFAERHPEIVLSPGVPDEQGPWMTPRTLEMTSNFLKQKVKRYGEIPTDSTTQESVAGMIGHAAAMTVFNFVRLEQEMPKYQDIVADPTGVPVPEGADSKMLVCYNLAHRVNEKDAAKVLIYIDRLGKEFAVTFAKSACTRMPMLVMTPAFTKWAQGNSSLMALMQQFR